MRVPLIAGLVGAGLLLALFGKYWPATSWTVLPRAELVAKAKLVSAHFGLDASDWKASTSPSIYQSLAHYQQANPNDANARAVSPLSLRIKLSKNGKTAEVGFDSAGLPVYWRAPEEFKGQQKFPSDDAAADAAFRCMAGPQAANFEARERSMGDEDREEDYTWNMPAPPHSDVRQRIKVVTQKAVVQTAERKAYAGSGDEDSDTGDDAGYWDVFSGIYGLLCSGGAVIIIGIYVLWLVRRTVNHKFPIRMAGVCLAIMIARVVGDWDFGTLFTAFFTGAMFVCLTAVGRGISVTARPKWMSLEQTCLLAPVGKSTGESLLAGLLFSPLLAALPFLVTACGLFHSSWVLPHNAEVLYSRWPMLDTVNAAKFAYLLGFFGFGMPAFARMIRKRWLRWMIVLPVGALFFADMTRVISGAIGAPLTAGAATMAVLWYVYAHFDLLAVLTVQVSSALLLSAIMLGQKGQISWGIFIVLAVLAVVAWWCRKRGEAVAEGDPLAANPAISGFRAEREKLKAEFSLARRAQQDMLPQTPPEIPGYTIAASCTPSLEVGGDLYDFLKLPDGRIGIGVADVSGKGVPAALYMTLTKGLLASVSRDSSNVSQVVEEVNRHLHSVTRKKVFVTMALGFLDAEKRVLECVRAGHNPVVWRQTAKEATTLVAPGGLGLGITAGRVFGTQLKVAEMALEDGDAVVFYSDGIPEAMNKDLEQFGEERLVSAVERTDRMDAAAARDSILGEVHDFLDGVHQQDDITLVVLRVGSSN